MKVNDNFPNAEITLKETVALMQQLEEVKKLCVVFMNGKKKCQQLNFQCI